MCIFHVPSGYSNFNIGSLHSTLSVNCKIKIVGFFLKSIARKHQNLVLKHSKIEIWMVTVVQWLDDEIKFGLSSCCVLVILAPTLGL